MHHCLQLWAFTCYHAPLCIIIMSQDTVLDQRQILGHISGYFLILYAFRKVRTQLVRLRNWTMLNPTCFFFSAWRLWCSSSWHAGELKTCRVESEPLTLRKYQAKLCQAQLESFSQYLRSIQKPLGKSRYQKTAKEVGPIITSNNNMSYAFICYDINYIYIYYMYYCFYWLNSHGEIQGTTKFTKLSKSKRSSLEYLAPGPWAPGDPAPESVF